MEEPAPIADRGLRCKLKDAQSRGWEPVFPY